MIVFPGQCFFRFLSESSPKRSDCRQVKSAVCRRPAKPRCLFFILGHAESEVIHLQKAFLIGAVGYPLLELLFRRRTHPSMALAGGLSAAAFHRISRTGACLAVKALAGGAVVTVIEGLCGLVFNRRHRIWDYRRMPLSWRGQVCLPYTLLWCIMAWLWMLTDRKAAPPRRVQPDRRALRRPS